ncbi:secreted RxLR effector protein 161-like [Apium graveolens]|uniref:secreted RxLR effector protein 161-like n=1 Tax=Apium graveolens TaxID=4045 RepID=UPI003D7BF46D
MEKPTILYFNVVKRILRYDQGTLECGLTYAQGMRNYILVGYAYHDLDGSLDDRRSTGGMTFYLNENLITWVSQKQRCMALSSCEAKFMAATTATCQGIWLKNLLRSKHIDVRYHFIRDCVERGEIFMKYIHTNDQKADILTKPMSSAKFEEMRRLLGVKNLGKTV